MKYLIYGTLLLTEKKLRNYLVFLKGLMIFVNYIVALTFTIKVI